MHYVIFPASSLHLLWFFRACRLKKKAQYEANKVKLWGLSTEYGEFHTFTPMVIHVMSAPLPNFDLCEI